MVQIGFKVAFFHFNVVTYLEGVTDNYDNFAAYNPWGLNINQIQTLGGICITVNHQGQNIVKAIFWEINNVNHVPYIDYSLTHQINHLP
jgi:hypothetical protein